MNHSESWLETAAHLEEAASLTRAAFLDFTGPLVMKRLLQVTKHHIATRMALGEPSHICANNRSVKTTNHRPPTNQPTS